MFKKRSELFDCNFVYFLIISLFVVIRIISSTFTIDTYLGYGLNLVIQVGLMFSLPLFLFSYLRKQKLKTTLNIYGFKKISVKSIFLSLLIGILIYFITIFIATFFSSILSLFGYESNSGASMTEYPIWLLVVELIFTAVLPGICEEVAHRGMLLGTYKKLGVKKAIILTGLMFGLMHLNIEQFFYTSIIGMFLGFIALCTDSIFPVMIMHFTNNAISTFMSYAITNNMPIANMINNAINSVMSNGLISIFLMFLIIMVLVGLVITLSSILIKDTKLKRIASVADSMVREQLRREIMYGIPSEETEEECNNDVELKSQMLGNKKIINIVFKKNDFYNNPYKPTFKDNLFMYVSLYLGIIITICTFIWGIL